MYNLEWCDWGNFHEFPRDSCDHFDVYLCSASVKTPPHAQQQHAVKQFSCSQPAILQSGMFCALTEWALLLFTSSLPEPETYVDALVLNGVYYMQRNLAAPSGAFCSPSVVRALSRKPEMLPMVGWRTISSEQKKCECFLYDDQDMCSCGLHQRRATSDSSAHYAHQSFKRIEQCRMLAAMQLAWAWWHFLSWKHWNDPCVDWSGFHIWCRSFLQCEDDRYQA